MKKLLVILISSLCIYGSVFAQIPAFQFEKAAGENYCFKSDATGRWQVVPCATIETAGGGSGGGGSVFEVTIANGNPTSTPTGTDPRVYLNAVNADLWTYDVDDAEWKQIGKYDARNGVSFVDGYTELGGQIVKHTIIEDPTDTYDMLFKKGGASFGFEENDVDGNKSLNLTNVSSLTGGTLITTLREDVFKVKTERPNGNSTILEVTPLNFSVYRDHQTTGNQFSMTQSGSSFALNLSDATRSSAIGFSGAGDITLAATDGVSESTIKVNGNIELRTPSVLNGTARNGMFLQLTDEDFGDVEWSDELNSDYIVTPSRDYDDNGVFSTDLTTSLADIYAALQKPDSDNQSLTRIDDELWIGNYPMSVDLSDLRDNTDAQALGFDPATGTLTLENSPSIILPFTSSGDNWGSQAAVADGITITGDGTPSNPLVAIGGSGGGSAAPLQKYYVGTEDDGVYVVGNTANVTYARSNNIATVTIPSGGECPKLVVNCNTSKFSLNDFKIRVVSEGASHNNDYSNSNVGVMKFIRTLGRRTVSDIDYWVSDEDAPPTTQKHYTMSTNFGGDAIIEYTFRNAKSSGTSSFKCLLMGHF